uniref:Uncharacterized protein n=1 Tax=Lygus hesperus TaxID=30085 RepID=A0A146LQ70_LYGHE
MGSSSDFVRWSSMGNILYCDVLTEEMQEKLDSILIYTILLGFHRNYKAFTFFQYWTLLLLLSSSITAELVSMCSTISSSEAKTFFKVIPVVNSVNIHRLTR